MDAAAAAAAAADSFRTASRPLFLAALASRAATFAFAAASRAARPCVSTARAHVATNASKESTSLSRFSCDISGASDACTGKNASTMVGTPPFTPAASEPCNDRCNAPSALSAARVFAASSSARFSAEPTPPRTEELVNAPARDVDSHASAALAMARLCASSISAVDAQGGISVTVSPVTSRRARSPGKVPATRDVVRRRHCARRARAGPETEPDEPEPEPVSSVRFCFSSRVNGASCTNARAVGNPNPPPRGTHPPASVVFENERKGKAPSSSSSSSRTSGSARVDPDPDPDPDPPELAIPSPGSASFRGARVPSSADDPRVSPRALTSQDRLASNTGSTAVTCTHAPSPASPDGGKGEIAGNAAWVPAAELSGVRLAWSPRSISPSVRSRGSRWIHVLPFRPSASQASPTSRTR